MLGVDGIYGCYYYTEITSFYIFSVLDTLKEGQGPSEGKGAHSFDATP